MCGIAGISGHIDKGALVSAGAALSHRGPDDSGYFVDGREQVGLIHTRLSIVDPSPAGHQPMCFPKNDTVIVFNGEIYNFRIIKKELERKGYSFVSSSDTAVILALYHDLDGDVKTMFRRLNGIFALAIWDAKKECLILSRDGLGVKPLYYSVGNGSFAFASEIKALLPLVSDLGGIDAHAIERYLTFLWCPGEGTPVNGVRKLGPGEAMWVREGVIVERMTWYKLPHFRSLPPLKENSGITVDTANYLRRAVHKQMVADVPVGAFLSGGLDSSSIVAFAREVDPNVRCFTIEVEGNQDNGIVDDLPFAKKVARYLSVPLEIVKVDASTMVDNLEAMVYQLDEPLADPACLNVFYISHLARKQGIKVLLSGSGGDDLFSGYRRHGAVRLERFWGLIPQSLLGLMQDTAYKFRSGNQFVRRLQKLTSSLVLDGNDRLISHFRWSARADLQALFAPEFCALLSGEDAAAPMLEMLQNLPSDMAPIDRQLMLEQRFFLCDHNLNYTDKMSMAAGVEVRVPFLDPDLVDFACRIPPHYKHSVLEGKWVLKKAMEPFLPRDVIYRPKSGFGAPLRRWMRHELRPCIAYYLSDSKIRERGIFEAGSVAKLIADNDAGRVDAAYTLLSLLCIEIWCRLFIDRYTGTKLNVGK